MSGNIVVNTRILSSHLTGVQRYTSELLSRFGNKVETISPRNSLNGINGHIWEQLVLPAKVGRNLLWSPSNAGPLLVSNQIVTIHDVVSQDHPEWLNPRFSAWYRFLTPTLARRVKKVIAISEFTKLRILEHCNIKEEKIVVIPNGVDSRFYCAKQADIDSMRQELKIPSPHYLVALGSLEPRKNLQRLLHAWQIVYTQLPDDVWLILAGAHGKKIVFNDVSLDKLPPRVHLTGHVPDNLLPRLYTGAIAAPYLSVYEGFGLPPLEAMACGTPPITGNLASLPEVVGDAGLMVDPYDIDAIAYAIREVVVNSGLRDGLRKKGIERAKSFSWDETAEKTWNVLHEAL